MSVFPFNLEGHLAFYLIVYVLTLVLHAVFMTYVLAGSMYLSWASIFPGRQTVPRAQSPLAKILREWMPFALSAAITAGVAPLLFVQIIYRKQFYTSNLLLGWRWMAVVPVLIVGFYLLYVIKSKMITTWKLRTRLAVVAGVSLCFLFVAFCWTTNHLLAISESSWATVYSTGNVIDAAGPLLLRLMTWVSGAFPCMCALAGWQIVYYSRQNDHDAAAYSANVVTLARMSFAGVILSGLFAVGYATTLPGEVRSSLIGSSGGLWLIAIAAGGILQLNGWWKASSETRLSGANNLFISAGAMLALTGIAFQREIIRFAYIDATDVLANTKSAANIGGFTLFVLSTIFNIGLMAFCLRLVRSAIAKPKQGTTST